MQMMSDMMLNLDFPKQEYQESLSMGLTTGQLQERIYIRKCAISSQHSFVI